jgi:hypothetical protein
MGPPIRLDITHDEAAHRAGKRNHPDGLNTPRPSLPRTGKELRGADEDPLLLLAADREGRVWVMM